VRALAGALRAAEEAGIERWINLAGISAGALVAALFAVGYTSTQVAEVLRQAPRKVLVPKRSLLGMSQLWMQGGIDDGDDLVRWLRGRFAASPVANAHVTFGDVGTSATGSDPLRRHRLRILVSDLSSGRVLTLPDDLPEFEDEDGKPLDGGAFPLAEAVHMSMALPFQYRPATLRRKGQSHVIVDGGILSSFPVWLFDAPEPQRPTWGIKVYASPDIEQAAERKGFAQMAGLILNRVMDADAYSAAPMDAARTLRIGTTLAPWRRSPKTADLDELEEAGYREGRDFFSVSRPYRNSFGASPHLEIVTS
jgi:NTE family protein